MPEEDKLCQMRRILTGLLPSELLSPLFEDIPFQEMVRRIELHAQLYSWANSSSEKINAESKTKAMTPLVKPTIAAAIQEGNEKQGNETAGKPDGSTVTQQNTPSTPVNSCQLCGRVGHQAPRCKRYSIHHKDHRDQRAHSYKGPPGRQNNRNNTPPRGDKRAPWCPNCRKKGHHINNCWAKNMPAAAASPYPATAAIGISQPSLVSAPNQQMLQLPPTPGTSQFHHQQTLQNPPADMRASAIPWNMPVAGTEPQGFPVNPCVNHTQQRPMVTYPSSPTNQQ